jgi:hypothetical protein
MILHICLNCGNDSIECEKKSKERFLDYNLFLFLQYKAQDALFHKAVN